MTASEMVGAIGAAARAAARADGPAGEFSRGQLMSAYSASRHLSVELAEFPAELRPFASQAAELLREGGRLAHGPELVALGGELAEASDPALIGDLIGTALDHLRDDAAPAAVVLRSRLHASLRALCDREVELLAEVIEAPRAG